MGKIFEKGRIFPRFSNRFVEPSVHMDSKLPLTLPDLPIMVEETVDVQPPVNKPTEPLASEILVRNYIRGISVSTGVSEELISKTDAVKNYGLKMGVDVNKMEL